MLTRGLEGWGLSRGGRCGPQEALRGSGMERSRRGRCEVKSAKAGGCLFEMGRQLCVLQNGTRTAGPGGPGMEEHGRRPLWATTALSEIGGQMRGREMLEDAGMAKVASPGKMGNKTKDQAESGLKRRGRTVCNAGESDRQHAPTGALKGGGRAHPAAREHVYKPRPRARSSRQGGEVWGHVRGERRSCPGPTQDAEAGT